MSRIEFFRQQVGEGREFLEATISVVTQAQAVWAPPGRALPIAAQYAHVVAAQDFGLAMLRKTAPLALAAWSGRTGMEILPPAFGHPWDEWGRQPFRFATLSEYARAVYAASDEYFAQLDESEWTRAIDLTAAGFGMQDVGFMLLNGWVTNVNLHCGEISCLMGLQDAKGYPA